MNSQADFTHEGVEFFGLPSQGSFYGVGEWGGKKYLAFVPMMQDGTPDTYEGAPNVGEVSNFDEDQKQLDEVNALLGTSFPMSDFFGR